MVRILLVAGLAGAFLVGGCASLPLNEAKLDSHVVCDAEFVAKVEQEARRHGSAVRWMRCPQLLPPKPPPFHYGDWRDA